MKKKYISPEITMIKLHTENVMGTTLSAACVKDYEGKAVQYNGNDISTEIKIWDGTSQPETAKDNGGNDLWGNEN